MLGTITVTGVRFHAFHGLTQLERKTGVRYRVDVELTTDIGPAAANDRVKDTIDYRDVHDLVQKIGRKNSYHLIETLAAELAREILQAFKDATHVSIWVQKETPVVDGIVDTVGVKLGLSRDQLDERSS